MEMICLNLNEGLLLAYIVEIWAHSIQKHALTFAASADILRIQNVIVDIVVLPSPRRKRMLLGLERWLSS